jgi:hypothetical protein
MSQLFIKGVKEPLNITREQGMKVEQVLKDLKIDKEQVVSIAGWTGPKKDIRFVTVEKEQSYAGDKEFSNDEMREFEKTELAKYLKDGQLSMRDEFRFYSDKGVARVKELKEDPRTFTDFDFAIIDVGAYKEASDKIGGWKEYRGRIEYAKKKEAEELEAIADQNNAG